MTNSWQITDDGISYTAKGKHRLFTLNAAGCADVFCTLSEKSLKQLNAADNISVAPKAVLSASIQNAPDQFSFVMRQPVPPAQVASLGDGLLLFYTGEIAYLAYLAADLDDTEAKVHDRLLAAGHAKAIGLEPNVKYVIDTGALEL